METFVGSLPWGRFIELAMNLLSSRTLQMAAIAVVFIPLERLIPFHPGQRLFRKHLWLDLLHYFVGGIFIIIFVRLTYYGMPALGLTGSPITVKHLPGWAQFLIFEASWTFLGYWVHRFEHVWRPLWRLHSIHESNEELDWLSAFRLHPLEPALFQVVTIVPLWFFGMSLPVAIAYKIYSYVFSHIQHANVVFPLPRFLKYVFPSPEFHRWHHARVFDENGNRVRSFQNFSEYPIWDILFGTFHLPKERPTAYGNAQHMPMDYFAQLAYPFGLHEHALSIQKRVKRWFGIEALKERIGRALSPTHEAFENRISKLSLTKEAP